MMKEQMEPMKDKKLRMMLYQNLDLKEYVKKGTLFSARKTWEVRSHMLDVAGNFPAHKKYESSNWMCQACGGVVREDQEHLTQCEGYKDLKNEADLNVENELVEFFTRVMERRKDNKWD